MSLPLVAFALAVMLGAMATGTDARAQRCATDRDCQPTGLRQEARCVGDTLVLTERRCLGGTCRSMERHQSCAVRNGGRCIGNVFESTSGRCDALLGRCARHAMRDVCLPSCTCSENILLVSTGQCSPSIGCHRVRTVCKAGCTCEPEPRCLDEPVQKSNPEGAGQREKTMVNPTSGAIRSADLLP